MYFKENWVTFFKARGSPSFSPFHLVFPEKKWWVSWIWLHDSTSRNGVPGKVFISKKTFSEQTVIFSYFWAFLGMPEVPIYWSFTALSSWEVLLPDWPEIKGSSSCLHPGLLSCIPAGAKECFYARGQQCWTSIERHHLTQQFMEESSRNFGSQNSIYIVCYSPS